MEPFEARAIETHKSELCETLEHHTVTFLYRLLLKYKLVWNEFEFIQSHNLNQIKIFATLRILERKKWGFEAVVTYLTESQMSGLASKIMKTAAAGKKELALHDLEFALKNLADQNTEHNLTGLCDAFVLQMLAEKKEAMNRTDLNTWRKSLIIPGLGRLALLGVIKNKFQFSRDEMGICQVKEESFESSLLLRSDPMSLTNTVQFAHRSIQEFLAAQYSVDFWEKNSSITSATGWPDKIWPIEGISEMKVEMLAAKMMRFGDSHFCRFYFGLLSGKPEFLEKTREALMEYADISLVGPKFFFHLSNCLADCSDAECGRTGEIVRSLVDKSFIECSSDMTQIQMRKIETSLWTEEKRMTGWQDPTRTEIRSTLQFGLKLKWLKNSFNCFYLRPESTTDSPSKLKMIYIWLDEENLVEKVSEIKGFDNVEWLWIRQPGLFNCHKLKFALEVAKLLPKCLNYVILNDSTVRFFIHLWQDPANSGPSGVNEEVLNLLNDEMFSQFSALKLVTSGKINMIPECSNRQKLGLAVSWDFFRNETDWNRPLQSVPIKKEN